MKRLSAGGGWPAIWYTVKQARASGGVVRMLRALTARNACKTCALGMGGQRGGMVNEAGRFPEVCKKSVQAMAADMQGRIRVGFFDEFDFHKLARLTPRELEHSGRLVEPLIAERGDRSYRPIGWDEAIDRVAQAMGRARGEPGGGAGPEAFFYFSGRSSNEAAFLLQLLARVYGTNNVNNCSYFCHQASGVALRGVTGSGTASIVLDDLAGEDGADLLIVIGANPASNHPRLMRTMIDIRRRGGKLIVINPMRELGLERFRVPSDVWSMLSPRGSRIADEYVQPHIGGDLALFAGIAKVLLEQENASIDLAFINDYTEGYEAFGAGIESLGWDDIEASSGVARAEIERIAGMYAASRKAVFAWTMGITHHTHGVDNVRMIAAVAMMRGMLGRPGRGLLPLRGHSNVQGIGSMGVEPKLKWQVLEAMQSRFGITLPTAPGLDTLACIDAAAQGRIRFAWHLGGNLYGSCPDSAAASRALGNVDTTVFLSTTLNTGHIHGRGGTSIILPVLARDEESQATTQESMFNYVRLSDGGRARYTGAMGPPLSEVEVMCRVFRAVLGEKVGGLDLTAMTRHSVIREAIAQIIPGYGPIAEMDRDARPKNGKPRGGEFQIPGRTLHEPKFSTKSGRARFFAVPKLPRREAPTLASGRELSLMTIRSEGQFNTVVYEETDLYRGQDRRDVILMNPEDIRALGMTEDACVTVRSLGPDGERTMADIRVRTARIRAGNAAMYYPEANALVPPVTDPESRTPAFKNIRIRVERSQHLPQAKA